MALLPRRATAEGMVSAERRSPRDRLPAPPTEPRPPRACTRARARARRIPGARGHERPTALGGTRGGGGAAAQARPRALRPGCLGNGGRGRPDVSGWRAARTAAPGPLFKARVASGGGGRGAVSLPRRARGAASYCRAVARAGQAALRAPLREYPAGALWREPGCGRSARPGLSGAARGLLEARGPGRGAALRFAGRARPLPRARGRGMRLRPTSATSRSPGPGCPALVL